MKPLMKTLYEKVAKEYENDSWKFVRLEQTEKGVEAIYRSRIGMESRSLLKITVKKEGLD